MKRKPLALIEKSILDISGKRALVTGASGGLGQHFAEVLAAHGAHVTLAARRVSALETICSSITARGGSACMAHLDVTDEASIAALFSTNEPFDIVINNAGINQPKRALEMSGKDWDDVMNTNLRGVFLVARDAARILKASGKGGSIINVASILGLRVAAEVAAYATSKAALVHLTKSLALEWARFGIRVNALCPGYVETDINRAFFAMPEGEELIRRIPQRRLGRRQDLDGALLLLASDASSYMTGTYIVVDGGHLVSTL